jgi:hypothetical protein
VDESSVTNFQSYRTVGNFSIHKVTGGVNVLPPDSSRHSVSQRATSIYYALDWTEERTHNQA